MESIMKNATKSVRFILILGVVTRVLTFTKEILIASKIGLSFETDAYFTAFAISTFLAEIMGEGISNGMVPVLMKIEEKEGTWKKVDYVNNLLNITFLTSILLMVLSWVLAPIITRIFAKGFSKEELKMTIGLVRMGLPIIIFIMLRAVFTAYLQSFHAFRAGAKSWIYYNMVFMIYLIFLSKHGVYGLMLAGVLASIIQLYSVIAASINFGYSYQSILDFKDIYVKEFGIMFMPIVIWVAVNRINLLVDKSVASTLETGSISWLNYGNEVIQLTLGLLITGIVTVLFPIMSEKFNRENIESLRDFLIRGIKIVFSIALPLTVILATLSQPIVGLLFERGEFGKAATLMTSQVLFYYSLGLGSMAIILIITKAHYAMHNSVTPMKYSLIGVLANFTLNIILSKLMGVKGIALATSVSTTLVTILLIMDLNKTVKIIDIKRGIKNFIKYIMAAAYMAVAIIFVYNLMASTSIVGDIIKILVPITSGLLIYLAMVFKLFKILEEK